ncbi:nuclease-related domain-containing protein [Psychrobacillus antarcticus]|uniref:nuclease-related domain-containing protein n=1 Tax=Psychrobacillus antarcticus TaxID=2879115 RepID=UPI00240823E2|nr:nuclease-related domain-containing protein [Psychrobacillus antarcticus]
MGYIEAGHYGELRVDRSIKEVQFPSEVHIIPDFHMKIHENRYIQIDTLLITSSYILIVEVKNIIGTINFKTSPNQLIRTLDDEITAFKCPIIQLQRNRDGLQGWLNQTQSKVPIYTVLVFASDKAIIEKAPKDQTILFAKNLPLYIQKLNKIPPHLTKDHFLKVKEIITQKNIHFIETPLCQKYEIPARALKKGVLCINCGNRLIKVSERQWKCNACGQIDKDPIPRNIEDLFILMKHEVTMKECMNLLQLKSRYTLNYTFQKMKLIKTKKGNNTTYQKSKT